MKTLLFTVTGQIAERTDQQRVVAKTRNYFRAKFTFDSEWDGLLKKAVFASAAIPDGVSATLIDNECDIPDPIMDESGRFTVSVYGGDLQTTTNAKVVVEPSGYQESPPVPPSDPLETFVKTLSGEQGIQMIRFDENGHIEAYNGTEWYTLLLSKDEIEALLESINESAAAALQSENNAKTSEDNAKGSETAAAQSAVDADNSADAAAGSAGEAAGSAEQALNNILNGISTHNTDATAHSAITEDIRTVEAIARGRSTSRVFDTLAEIGRASCRERV
jgi:hypothetical protein